MTRLRFALASALWCAIAALPGGCVSNDAGHCTPGAQSLCACSGAKTLGVQTCVNDGSGYTRCEPCATSAGAPPTSTATPPGGPLCAAGVTKVTVKTSKPAFIYYTTDGTTPTETSAGAINQVTIDMVPGRLKFFAADASGAKEHVHDESYVLDKDPPAPVTELAGKLSGSKVELSWSKPAADTAGVIVLSGTTSSPGKPVDCKSYEVGDAIGGATVVYAGNGAKAVLTTAPDARTYSVYAFDAARNYAVDAPVVDCKGGSKCVPRGKSCREIQAVGGSVGDGVYLLDGGEGEAFEAYCDMTTDGGGWTLVMNVAPADGNSVGYANQAFWTDDAEYGAFDKRFANDYKSPAAFRVSGKELLIQSTATGASGAILGWRRWPLMSPRTFDSFFTSGIVPVHGSDSCETGAADEVFAGTTSPWDDIIRQGTCLYSDVNPSSSGEGDTIRLTTIAGDNTDNNMSGFASCIDCGANWQGATTYMGLDRAPCSAS